MSTATQRIAWLRKILAHLQANLVRDLRRDKRDVSREIDLALDRSAVRLEALLPADHTSPSQRAARGELVLLLATALEALPDDQREVVSRHYLLGESLAAISAALDRSTAAVAGLLQRGLRKLRELLPAE